MGRERTKHPTQKPKKVVSHLVKLFTNENDIILDCFAGSGTLAEVAGELKRRSINIEDDKSSFQIMVNRLKMANNNLFNRDNKILEITDERDIVFIK